MAMSSVEAEQGRKLSCTRDAKDTAVIAGSSRFSSSIKISVGALHERVLWKGSAGDIKRFQSSERSGGCDFVHRTKESLPLVSVGRRAVEIPVQALDRRRKRV